MQLCKNLLSVLSVLLLLLYPTSTSTWLCIHQQFPRHRRHRGPRSRGAVNKAVLGAILGQGAAVAARVAPPVAVATEPSAAVAVFAVAVLVARARVRARAGIALLVLALYLAVTARHRGVICGVVC